MIVWMYLQIFYINQDKCGECNICHLIDEGSFSDFYLINPDTVGINKEEIDKLFHVFQDLNQKLLHIILQH